MRQRLAIMLGIVGLVAAVLSALAFLGGSSWQLDLLAQFRFQAALGAVALFVVAAAARAKWGALLAALCVGLNLYALLAVPVAAKPQADAPSLHVAAFNLLGDNRRIDDVVGWLREQQFDVVSLEELTPAFAAQLDALADVYPYRLMLPRKGGFGIGIISRHKLLEQETLFPASATFPVLRVRIELGHETVEVFAVHPPPPLTKELAVAHDATLSMLAVRLKPEPHRIVMGDFNSAPTGFALRLFCADLALAGPGVLPRLSWPSDLPWPLRIPIDHILVGNGMALDSVQNGPSLGSDHFPQIATVSLVR